MKWGVLSIGVLALLAAVFYFWPVATELPEVVEPEPEIVAEPEPAGPVIKTIGASVEERPIEVYEFGTGESTLLFVGGVHGGYEWNSVALAYEMIEHFTASPELIPDNLTVSIIPNLNPDGLAVVTDAEGQIDATNIADPTTRVAAGRFNANNVDLNRNFDCNWAPKSSWRGSTVSAGTEPFSEPEAAALRDYVTETMPEAVVFWHSQANNVYASECGEGPLPETLEIMNAYASAGGYGAVSTFDAYPITGDAEGWLASIGIPAITVEFESFQSTEWSRNNAGVAALLNYYSVAR